MHAVGVAIGLIWGICGVGAAFAAGYPGLWRVTIWLGPFAFLFFRKGHEQVSQENQRFDPQQMKTEAGRKMAGTVNRQLDASKERRHRLLVVLEGYLHYDREWQLQLAEVAIVCTIGRLAAHEHSDKCKSAFYALVDMLYAFSDDATTAFSEIEQEQIYVAASAAYEHVVPALTSILRSSNQQLMTMEENSPFRLGGRILQSVRGDYLKHASAADLQAIIVHCSILRDAAELHYSGLPNTIGHVTAELQAVLNVSHKIQESVFQAIREGRLLVQDGRIVSAT